ncbi:hypothetical protein ACC694_21120 [Rhizobium ruizarguesonis]
MAINVNPEFRPLSISRVQLAVGISVEDMLQRLKVAGCRRIPLGEGEFARTADLAVSIGVKDENAISFTSPRRPMLITISLQINKSGGLIERTDRQPTACNIDDYR